MNLNRDPQAHPFAKAYRNWRYRVGLDPGTYLFRFLLTSLIALYFGLPVIWLFLAPTKTHKQMTDMPPLSIGTLQNVADSWQRLAVYNRGVIFNWAWNSVWYVALALTLATAPLALGWMLLGPEPRLLVAVTTAVAVPSTPSVPAT